MAWLIWSAGVTGCGSTHGPAVCVDPLNAYCDSVGCDADFSSAVQVAEAATATGSAGIVGWQAWECDGALDVLNTFTGTEAWWQYFRIEDGVLVGVHPEDDLLGGPCPARWFLSADGADRLRVDMCGGPTCYLLGTGDPPCEATAGTATP